MTILEESLHLYFISISGFILFCRRNCRAIGLGGVYHYCCWASPCGIEGFECRVRFSWYRVQSPRVQNFVDVLALWPFVGCVQSRERDTRSVVFPCWQASVTLYLWFRHTLWLPFVAAFAVLKELRAEVAVRINHRKIRVLVSLFNEVGGLKYRSLIAVHSCVLLF